MAKNRKKKLRIIPLGGVGEIGKNMTVLEYGEDILIIDCGLTFPKEEMLGIDLVIPDIQYLLANTGKIRGIVITHGHEDHIGAVPYVLKQINPPIYGTRLSLALVEQKLKEHKITNAELNCVNAGDTVKLGAFAVEFLTTSHSIAGSVALAIHTPVGVVFHTGDFKVDYTPVAGEMAAFARFAALGEKGVLLMMSDSTNVEYDGYSMSEKTVGESLDRYFREGADMRIIVATFASNIHRIQQIVDHAMIYGRKVVLCGRSIVNICNLAMDLGELVIPPGALVDLDNIDKYPKDKVVVITTGSQGEPMSGLARMASNDHNKLKIGAGDLVIISASPIPGNERTISNVINNLFKNGALVIYKALGEVHVSGHAFKEELKLMHRLIKPKFFIPVHGEFRHLKQHALLAESLGMPGGNIVLPELGSVIEVDSDSIAKNGTVPAGAIMIDGLGVGDVGNIVMRDRKHLSQDGLFIIVITMSAESGDLMTEPDIVSRGFVYM
ncbi:MAG TPA: ribonuclease J, partial [Clostridia bacterium]|nr:ribonuclease J [Clostridia bacterium]